MGVAYLNMEKPENALEKFSDAIDLDPKLAEAYYNRANVHVKLLHEEEACRDIKKAAELRLPQAIENMDKVCI